MDCHARHRGWHRHITLSAVINIIVITITVIHLIVIVLINVIVLIIVIDY